MVQEQRIELRVARIRLAPHRAVIRRATLGKDI
jgi:hypothetical protein